MHHCIKKSLGLASGVSFTNVLSAAFAYTNPKSAKDTGTGDLTVFLRFWDVGINILVKSTPGVFFTCILAYKLSEVSSLRGKLRP
jgi:hypothetical protein